MAKRDDHIHEMLFVIGLHNAPLDDGQGLTGAALEWLSDPPTHQLQIEDPGVQLALENFITLEHSLEDTYNKIHNSSHKCFPDSLLPTLYHVKQLLVEMTGVTPLVNKMCINSCLTYTGPYLHLQECPYCHQP